MSTEVTAELPDSRGAEALIPGKSWLTWDGCTGPQSPPSFLLPGHWWLLPRAALTPLSTGLNWSHFKAGAVTRGGKEKVPLLQQGSGNLPQQSQTELFPLMDRIPQTPTQLTALGNLISIPKACTAPGEDRSYWGQNWIKCREAQVNIWFCFRTLRSLHFDEN